MKRNAGTLGNFIVAIKGHLCKRSFSVRVETAKGGGPKGGVRKPRKRVAQRGGAEGSVPEGCGPWRVGGPKFRAYFSSLFRFFSTLLKSTNGFVAAVQGLEPQTLFHDKSAREEKRTKLGAEEGKTERNFGRCGGGGPAEGVPLGTWHPAPGTKRPCRVRSPHIVLVTMFTECCHLLLFTSLPHVLYHVISLANIKRA